MGGRSASRGVCPILGGSAQPRGSASRGVCPTLGGLPNPGGEVCIWGGLPNPRGVCIQGGLPNPVGSASRGSAQPRGVCVCIQGLGRPQTPLLPVNRMTHRCKTLPCPELRLRAMTRTPQNLVISMYPCAHS